MDLPVESAIAAASADGEFRIAARFWNASLRIVCGEETHSVEIRNGEPFVVPNNAAVTPSLTIEAPPDVWNKMLEPVPAPFYHDVFAAATKHDVKLAATTEDAATSYYPAIRRFVELLRNARNNDGQV